MAHSSFLEKFKISLKSFFSEKQLSTDQDSPHWRTELFHSARLKLTGFYLVILIIFSLTLTLSLRTLANHTFDRAGQGDRGAVRQLLLNYYSVPIQPNSFNNYQHQQSQDIHHDLNEYVIVVNVAAIIFGGLLSYWYAGKTLRPIEQAHDAQARFASDASHELRTPLAALRLENEVFLHQKQTTEAESREIIKSNLEEAKRLENLADSLLYLTQYSNINLDLRATSIDKIIEIASDNTAKLAKAKHISLHLNTISKAEVLGNEESLVQLLTIVIDNAIKYSPVKTTIFIDVLKDKDNYHLSIRDEGPGILEEDLNLIFDRLYRGDKSRSSRVAGYGLGLSLAKEIATANKATIIARNYPEGGAQFVITLPAK